MKKKKTKLTSLNHRLDLLYISLYEVCVTLIVIFGNLRFYQSSILFFFIPAFFLISRKTKKIKHIFIASVGGLGFGFIFDFFATLNQAWYIPNNQIVFPRILGIVPIDDLIWFVGWIFFMTTFYEHFLDRTKTNKISSHLKWAIFLSLVILGILLSMFFMAPALLHVQFAYLLCIVASLPFFIYIITHKPSLVLTLLKLGTFFAPVLLLHELSALITHQWNFPGNYIGHVELFGLVMPFEEFFFWILISPLVVIAYYEFFVEE